MATTTAGVTVNEMTEADGRAMFDMLAKDRLGIAGQEFLRRLDDGEYDDLDSEDVVRLSLMAPFAR